MIFHISLISNYFQINLLSINNCYKIKLDIFDNFIIKTFNLAGIIFLKNNLLGHQISNISGTYWLI